MRKKLEQDDVLAPQSDAPVPLAQEGAKRARKITLKLTDEGRIDWAQVPDASLERLQETANDPGWRTVLKGDAVAPEAPVNHIEPRHVHSLLEILGVIERSAFPVVLARKYKIKLHPKVVDTCFRFTPEQKEQIGEPGATTFNMLPERARGWIITATCPSEFATLVGEAIKQQFENALLMQAKMVAQMQRTQKPPNGEMQTPVGEQQEPVA